MIISMSILLKEAKKSSYGVAAPNVFNRETIEAAFKAGEKLRAPVILDVHPVHGPKECAGIVRYFEKQYPEVPAALNLDHGATFDQAMEAIHAGFSSVMVDRSTLPFDENVAQVKEIVKVAHSLGVSVEAELGHVGQGTEYAQTRDAGLTRPEEAVSYVEQTQCDCLAVSVGTSHGMYHGTPHIDFELLSKLAKEVAVPLVLHGGSNTGDENLKSAVAHGISKINLNTDLNEGGLAAVKAACEKDFCREVKQNGGSKLVRMNLQTLFTIGADGWQSVLEHYMQLFGSAGRF